MARSSPPSPFMQKFWDDYYSEKVKVKEVPEEEGDSGKAKKQPEEPLSFKAPEHKPSMFLQGFKQYKTEIEKEIDKANKEADRLRAKGFTNEQIDEEVGGRLRNLSSQIAVRTKGQFPAPELKVNIPPKQLGMTQAAAEPMPSPMEQQGPQQFPQQMPPQMPPQVAQAAPQGEFEWGQGTAPQEPGFMEQAASALIPFEIQQKLFGSQVPGDVQVLEETKKGAIGTGRAAVAGIKRAPYAAGQMMAEATIGAKGFGSETMLNMAKLLREADKELLEGKYKLPPDIEKSQFLSDVASGMEMLGPMAAAVLPSLITGNPLAAIPTTMALFGLSTYNNTKEELLAAGVDPKQAERTAIIHGISEGGIESIGTFVELVTAGFGKGAGAIAKKAAKKATQSILKTLAAEYGEEYAEEVAQGATEKYLKDKYKDNPKVQKLSWEQVLKGPITPLLVSMIPLVGAGQIAQRAGRRPPAPPAPPGAPLPAAPPTAPPAAPAAPAAPTTPAAPPVGTTPAAPAVPVEPTPPAAPAPGTAIPTLPLGPPVGTTPAGPTPVTPAEPTPGVPGEPVPVEPTPPVTPAEPTIPGEPIPPKAPKLPLLPPEAAKGVKIAGYEVLPDDQVPTTNEQMVDILKSHGEVVMPLDKEGNQSPHVYQHSDDPDTIQAQFNSPYTGSTIGLHPSQLTLHNINKAIEENYLKFRNGKMTIIRPSAKFENIRKDKLKDAGPPLLMNYDEILPGYIDFWGEDILKGDRGVEVPVQPTPPAAPKAPMTAQQAIYQYSQKLLSTAKTTQDIAAAEERVGIVSKYLMAVQQAPYKPSGYFASLYGPNPSDVTRLMEVRREVDREGYVDTYYDESGVQYQGLKGTPKPENLYTYTDYTKIITAKKKVNVPPKEQIEGLLAAYGAKYTGLQVRIDGGVDITFSKDGKNYTLNAAQWSNQAVRDVLGIKAPKTPEPTLPIGTPPPVTPTPPPGFPPGFDHRSINPFGYNPSGANTLLQAYLNKMYWVHEGFEPVEHGSARGEVIHRAKRRSIHDDRIIFLALSDFRKSASKDDVDHVILVDKDGVVLEDNKNGTLTWGKNGELTYDAQNADYYEVKTITYEDFLKTIEPARKLTELQPWQMLYKQFDKAVDRFPYLSWDNYKTSEKKVKAAQVFLEGLVQKAKSGHRWTRHNVHELVHQLGMYLIRSSLPPNVLGRADEKNEIEIKNGLYDANGILMPDAIETVLHEISHNLVYTKSGTHYWHVSQYDKQPLVRGEWKIVEEMISHYNPQTWDSKHTYYTKQTERYARLFTLYFLDNSELKQRCPTLYAKMEREILASYPAVVRNRDIYFRMRHDALRMSEKLEAAAKASKTKLTKMQGTMVNVLRDREARQRAAHAYYIELALEQGLPVPAEVRKEYDAYIKEDAQYWQKKNEEAARVVKPAIDLALEKRPYFRVLGTRYINDSVTLVDFHDLKTGITWIASFNPKTATIGNIDKFSEAVEGTFMQYIEDAYRRGDYWVGVEENSEDYHIILNKLPLDDPKVQKMMLYYEEQKKRIAEAGGQMPVPKPPPQPQPKPKKSPKINTWVAWLRAHGGVNGPSERGDADFLKEEGLVGLWKKDGGESFDRLLEIAKGDMLVKESMTLDEFKEMIRQDIFNMKNGKPRMFGFNPVENTYNKALDFEDIRIRLNAKKYRNINDFISAEMKDYIERHKRDAGKRIIRYGTSDIPIDTPLSKEELDSFRHKLTHIWKKVNGKKLSESDQSIDLPATELAWTKAPNQNKWVARTPVRLEGMMKERMVNFSIEKGVNSRGQTFYRLRSLEAKTFYHQFFPSLKEAQAEAQRLVDEVKNPLEEYAAPPKVNKSLTNSFYTPDSAETLSDDIVNDIGSFTEKGTGQFSKESLLNQLYALLLNVPRRTDVRVVGTKPFIRLKLDGETFLLQNNKEQIEWFMESVVNSGKYGVGNDTDNLNISSMNNGQFLNSMYDGMRDFIRFRAPSLYASTHNLMDYFRKRIDLFKFFPHLPEDYVNDIRKYVVAALEKARYKVYGREGYAGQIFGKMKEREILQTVELIYARDEVGRQKAGKGNPEITLAEAEARRDELEAAAPEQIIVAANKWREIVETVRINLVNRGRLKETDMIEDYAPHSVGIYTPEWAFVVGIPTRIRRPFRQYVLKARGSAKEIVKDAETLMGHLLKIEHHNMIEDFIARETAKYNVIPRLNKDQRIALFGGRTYTRLVKSKDYPEGRKVKITVAKKPKPGTVYLEEELVRISESFRGRGNFWAYSPDHPFSLTVYTNPDGLRVLGGYKNVSLIPEAIYNSFKEFSEAGSKTLYYLNLLTGYWKNMAILSHFPSFNINNMIGDTFMAAMQHPDPASFVKELSTSFNYLVNEIMGRPHTGYLAGLHKFMVSEDVLGASFFHTELPGRLRGKRNIPKAIFETTMTVSQMREAICRVAYASSLYKAMQEGRGSELIRAHTWINTRKLPVQEALGKIARDVLIDYGAVSKTFKWLARGLLTPFGTWYFKGSKLAAEWAWHNKGKALGSFMAIPILAALFNNRDDDSREMEMHHEDWVRGTIHFNLGKNPDGTARVLILQLPQDALIGTKIFSIATDYGTRVLRGEMKPREAAIRTVREWGGKEARGLVFLTAPFVRFFWGWAEGRDPYDKSPVFSRPREQLNRMQKVTELAYYFTKTMVPVLTVSLKQYQYKTPADVLWKQTLDRFIGKESLGIYDLNPKGELKLDDKYTIKYEDLAMAKWKGNQVYPYIQDVEREWVAFKGETDTFLQSKEFLGIMADLYDFRSKTDPELFPQQGSVEDKGFAMTGFYAKEIANMFADPDVIQNRMRVQMERADTDEEKKKIREEYDLNMQSRIFDSYQHTYKKERELMMKKKMEDEDYPWQDVLTMP